MANNIVYFSSLLQSKCPVLHQSLVETLHESAIDFRWLTGTKDIWCRDYMPIQADMSRFVFYQYRPDYLQAPQYLHLQTDVNQVPEIEFLKGGSNIHLDLVIDGGNVVCCGNKVVMTEKVFYENSTYSPQQIQQLLEDAFLREVVFLPWDRNEIYGHSDGIIHFAGENKVLLKNYSDFDKEMACRFEKILCQHFDVIPLVYNVKRPHARSWSYINFLQIGTLVLVPQLGIPEDELAITQIAQNMPACQVKGIPAIEAVRRGGALNCISWNIIQ